MRESTPKVHVILVFLAFSYPNPFQMLNSPIRILLILMIVLLWMGCKKDSPSEEQLATANFPDEIGEVVINSCAIEGCHNSVDAPGGLSLGTWAEMFKGSDFGAMTIPYQAEWSHVFQHINTFSDLGPRATPVMPESSDELLTREQVQMFKDWINTGAHSRDDVYRWEEEEKTGTGKLFTLCSGSDLVAVTDLETNLVMRLIELGNPDVFDSPHYITVSPDNQFFYVSMIVGGTIDKYRTDNYEFVGKVEISATSPALIVLNQVGTRAFVTHYNPDPARAKLTYINTENMTVIQSLKESAFFLSNPHGIKASKDFKTLYIAAGNYFARFSVGENGITEPPEYFPLNPGDAPNPDGSAYDPYQVFLTEDETKLFISCNVTSEVRVMDTQTGDLLKVIPTAKWPRLMDYDPITDLLFVACRDEENFSEQGSLQGCVSVIDVGNMSFKQNIYNLGHRPHGVSVSVKGRKVYVSSENTGGADPGHHPVEGGGGPPGKYNVIDLNTLEVLKDEETEIATIPNATAITE